MLRIEINYLLFKEGKKYAKTKIRNTYGRKNKNYWNEDP